MRPEDQDEADRLEDKDDQYLKEELEAAAAEEGPRPQGPPPWYAGPTAAERLESLRTHETNCKIVQQLANLLSEPHRPTAESIGLFFDWLVTESMPIPPVSLLIGQPWTLEDDQSLPAMEALQRRFVPMLEFAVSKILSGDCTDEQHSFGFSRGRALGGSVVEGDYEVGFRLTVSSEFIRPPETDQN